jgi:SAM-dependent methyltransferase
MPRHEADHLCPPWIGRFLAFNPPRRLLYSPRALLSGLVSEGMIVLEPGPGMGFFTLDLARLAGPSGRVVAVDVQPKMLDGLRRRAARAGLLDRLELRLVKAGSLGVSDLTGRVGFALAFAMAHEVPEIEKFWAEIATVLAPGGRLLFSEPSWHVAEEFFHRELRAALASGLRMESRPVIPISRSVLLVKDDGKDSPVP